MVDNLPCSEAVPFYESFPLEYVTLTPLESTLVVPIGTIIYFEITTNNRCNNDWYHNGVRKYTMNGVSCTKLGRNFGTAVGTHTIKIDSYNRVNSLSHIWTIEVVPNVENGVEQPYFDIAVQDFSPSQRIVTINKGETIPFSVQTTNECTVTFNDGTNEYPSIVTQPFIYSKDFAFASAGQYNISAIIKRSIYDVSVDWQVTVLETDVIDNTDTPQNDSGGSVIATAIACGAFALIYLKNKDKK